MARIRYHDFRQEDSTKLFNDRFRGIIRSGVYLGFNVSTGGSGGSFLQFQHDADPDNTGQVLGKIVTPDGLIIEENEDQDDVVQGSFSAGTPNVHYVVASYQYNAALPNNDVVYAVKQGTAGSPPTPPTLSDDEVLLAEIDVPSGAGAYTTAGVSIKTVAKTSLYGDSPKVVRDSLSGIIDPGIYEGIEMSEGSTLNDVDISAGVWVTQENRRIEEVADLADEVTITPPSSGNHKLSWLIAAHKTEDTDPAPTPDYLLVQGSDSAFGTAASLPSDATIQAAVFAVDTKYDDDADSLAELDYINKLGIIRSENRGGTVTHTYIKGTTVLDEDTIVVHAATSRTLNRSGKYYGANGLIQALSDVHGALDIQSTEIELPFNSEKDAKPLATVLLDGDFHLSDRVLEVPSGVLVKGIANSKIYSDLTTDSIKMEGLLFEYNGVDNTIAAPGAGSGTPPSGYVAKSFSIQATYQVGDTLPTKKFLPGDRVLVSDGSTHYEGVVVSVTGDWTFDLWIETQYQTDGNPADVDITVFKTRAGLVNIENTEEDGTTSGVGKTSIEFCDSVFADNLRTEDLVLNVVFNSVFGSIVASGENLVWHDNYGDTWHDGIKSSNNRYRDIRLTGDYAGPTFDFALSEEKSEYGHLSWKGGTAAEFRVLAIQSKFDVIEVESLTGSVLDLNGMDQCYVGLARNSSPTGSSDLQLTDCNELVVLLAECIDDIILSSCSRTMIGAAKYALFTDDSPNTGNSVLSSQGTGTQSLNAQSILDSHHDKNMVLNSDADISWDLATQELSWDDHITLMMPWTDSAYSRLNLSESPKVIADGSMLVITVDRDQTTSEVDSTLVEVISATDRDTSIIFNKNKFVIAFRKGDVVYLRNGTRVEDGQTVKLGATPPPDGSVTYEKLGDSAVSFHNEVYRPYVSIPETDLWENSLVVQNTGLLTFTYTPATGVIQYSGTIDLSEVQVGDTIILRNTSWSDSAGNRAMTRERILEIDDGANNVTICQGLDVTPGAANRWNGAIVRGNVILRNTGLVSFTYDAATTNPGRITFNSGLGFNSNMVHTGSVFVDSAGERYLISDADSSGSGLWVQIEHNGRDVNVSAPTSEIHGSIETNNNPFGLDLSDLSVRAGLEYIPLRSEGDVDTEIDYTLSPIKNVYPSESPALCVPEPYDNRVRIGHSKYTEPNSRTIFLTDASGYPSYHSLTAGDNKVVVFTGFCTGFMYSSAEILNSSDGAGSSIYVDGKLLTDTQGAYRESTEEVYDLGHFRYPTSLGADSASSVGNATVLRRLPPGVHTIVFRVPSVTRVGGLFIFNDMSPNDSVTPRITDSPGVAVIDGKVITKSSPTYNVSVPTTPPSGWQKGSRHVRYLKKDGTHNFANEYIRNFTGTGNVSSGSADVTVVSNPTEWRVGDLIGIFDTSSGTKYIQRILSISGTTLTTNKTISFTQSSLTLYYYGNAFGGTSTSVVDFDDDSSSTNTRGSSRRNDEDIMAVIPMTEMACGGPTDDNRGISMFDDSARTEPVGVRIGDGSTGVAGSPGISNHAITSTLTGFEVPDGDTIRLIFTGTGLSIMAEFPVLGFDMAITLDGQALGNLEADSDPENTHDSKFPGAYKLFGELPYGTHIVDLTPSGDVLTALYGMVIYQPKKPSIVESESYLELWDTNALSIPESDLNGDNVAADGVNVCTQGTLNIEWGSLITPIRTTGTAGNVLRDFGWGDITFSTIARSFDNLAGTDPDGHEFHTCFYGTELTMVLDARNGTTPMPVEILDHDGQWQSPGSTTGFTTTGNSTITGVASTRGERFRYTFDKLDWHCIRIRCVDNANSFELNAIEVNTPFHTYKNQIPQGIDHYLPAPFDGRDLRVMSPIPWDRSTKGQRSVSHYAFMGSPLATPESNHPFWFYSLGGDVEITVNAEVTEVSSNIAFNFKLDGQGVSNVFPSYAASASEEKSVSIQYLAKNLRKGLHYITVSDLSTTLNQVSYLVTAHEPMYSKGDSRRSQWNPPELNQVVSALRKGDR